jgi:uncharacterized protein YllA (UPF0747 family)
LSRPLMQDYVLPVLGVVLGPSELAYWGILGPAFNRFGMSMPLLLPRQSYTYMEPNIVKLMDKFDLTVPDVIESWETRRKQWLSQQDERNLEQQFKEVKEQFAQLYAPILEAVTALQPGLAGLAETNRDKIIEQMTYLESRSVGALAKRHEASLRQWDRIHQSITPMDKPQERIYGAIHFWNRYGPTWLKRWMEVPYELNGGHRLVEGLTTLQTETGGIIV